jgi:hypothetical protein
MTGVRIAERGVAHSAGKRLALAMVAPVRDGRDKGNANDFALNLAAGVADPRDTEFERM